MNKWKSLFIESNKGKNHARTEENKVEEEVYELSNYKIASLGG